MIKQIYLNFKLNHIYDLVWMSAFLWPEEQEVLIQQGLPFNIHQVTELQDQTSGAKYIQIEMETSERLIDEKNFFEFLRVSI